MPTNIPLLAKSQLNCTIPSEVINEILNIYTVEHRYVLSAKLNDAFMECSLKPTVYPYTEKQIFSYVTAPTVTILACQLAYVLIGGMVINKHSMVASISSWEDFLQVRDLALLRFGRFEVRFTSKVENEYPISASIQMTKSRSKGRITHCLMNFSVGSGISGKIHGALLGAKL